MAENAPARKIKLEADERAAGGAHTPSPTLTPGAD
jgi:hypothetical protein